jgi:hypothetical protein
MNGWIVGFGVEVTFFKIKIGYQGFKGLLGLWKFASFICRKVKRYEFLMSSYSRSEFNNTHIGNQFLIEIRIIDHSFFLSLSAHYNLHKCLMRLPEDVHEHFNGKCVV